MRRVIVAASIFMSSLAVLAMPRQTVFIRASAQDLQKRIGIMAQSMQRDGAVTHATGNVQVRITHAGGDRTVIRADEIIYHEDTGEIETHGDARITIEKGQ